MIDGRIASLLGAFFLLSSLLRNGAIAEDAAENRHPGLKISGNVVDANTGKPIQKFRLVQTGEDGPARHLTWQSQYRQQFSHGHYDLPVDGPWTLTYLRFDAEGYRPFASEPIKRDAGAVTLDVKLQPDAGLAGKVLTPDGKPAVGAQVAICTWTCEVTVEGGRLRHSGHGLELSPFGKTDADGAFRMPAEIDRWVLVVAHDAGYAEATSAEFAKSPTVQLRPWGRLEVKYAPDGKPVADQRFNVGAGRGDVEVNLNYSESPVTDAQGKFLVERMPPVSVFVQPFFKTREMGSVSLLHFSGNITIEPGKTKRLILPRLGQTITGRIALPPDNQLTIGDFDFDVSISLKMPSVSGFQDEVQKEFQAYREFVASEAGKAYRQSMIPVNELGEFTIAGLPETEYVLQVRAKEKKSHADDLTRRPLEGWHARRVTVPPRPVSADSLDLGEIVLDLKEQNEPVAPANVGP